MKLFEVPFEGKMHYAGVDNETILSCRAEAREQAKRAMQQFVSALEADDRVSHFLEFGYAPSVIREKAEILEPDLIVMGKHGQSAWEDLLPGGVTRQVVREADFAGKICAVTRDHYHHRVLEQASVARNINPFNDSADHTAQAFTEEIQ